MSMNEKTASASTVRRPLRVLLVEDSQPDAVLLKRALERGGFELLCERVDTREAMKQALEKQPWDLILADHAMPQFSAPEALDLVKKHGLDVPFIIVSGHIEEETAVAAMRAGAHDYIMKERLARLVPAVERELREAEVRRARKKSEEELRRAHEELELRVEKRTADLRAANRMLENFSRSADGWKMSCWRSPKTNGAASALTCTTTWARSSRGFRMMIKGLEQKLAAEGHPLHRDAPAHSGADRRSDSPHPQPGARV